MSRIYQNGPLWWADLTDETGKRRRMSTGVRADGATEEERAASERKAREVLAVAERKVEALKRTGEGGPMTLARYAERWIKRRKADGLVTAADDDSRLKLYVLPTLGALRLEDIRPHHVRDLVRALKSTKSTRGKILAPRSVRHVYGTLHAMLHEAVADELMGANPCVLRRTDMPKARDADPTWRPTAVYTREEVERLFSDEQIPVDRRVLVAIKALAGLRHGEAAVLRWRDYDREAKPLGRLIISASFNSDTRTEKTTKTESVRQVPVHATLGVILGEWRLSGWESTYGRRPTADDYIVPARTFNPRTCDDAAKALREDLASLGLRHRRGHDLRRTFVSLALADGARRDLLECITHGPRGDIISLYHTPPWESLCGEVAKLRLSPRGGAWHTSGTVCGRWRNASEKVATPAGFEPASPA